MLKNKIRHISFFILILLCSCLKEEMLVAKADFVIEETITPNGKIAKFINLSTGGEAFEWTFENGSPATSNDFNPGEVSFMQSGTHTIQLKVSNKDGSVSTIEKQIVIETSPTTDFNYEILINNYAPAEIQLTNLSQNIASYNWSFTSGVPANSTDAQPANVIFSTPGQHTITLNTVGTNNEVGQKTITFDVLPELNADFDYTVLPIDNDYNAPVKVFIQNNTISATSYSWEVIGANPSNTTAENPSFVFNSQGNYQIKLTATNGKQTQTVIKNIQVLAYTNLSIQNDVKFGINTAQNTLGCYYSTVEKTMYKSNQIDSNNGPLIDIVFFGLGSTFSSNVFVSPTNTNAFGLATIPNATATTYTNKQENCSCTVVTENQFNAMTSDAFLQTLSITNETTFFNNGVLPRIIPFATADGRKGLLKVKSFVNDGANSYVLVDIKVQKSL